MVGRISDGRDTVVGMISEPHPPAHRASLVERHEITESIPATGGDKDEVVKAIVLRCHAAAMSWADQQGLAIRNPESLRTGTSTAGVRFEVTIGAGAAADDESTSWGWSDRWQPWYAVLHRVARGYRQSVHVADAEPDLATVIPLFASEERSVVGSEYGID